MNSNTCGVLGSDEEKPTPWEDVTGYNNYYEFGTGKDDPARNAGRLRTRPWKVEVAGEVKRPAVYDLDDLPKGFTPPSGCTACVVWRGGRW